MYASATNTLLVMLAVVFADATASFGWGEEYRLQKNVVISVMEQLEVPAQAEGPLLVLNVREGDLVRKGDIIARIRDDEAKLELERSRINLENAIALSKNSISLRLAKIEFARANAELSRAKRWSDKVKDAVSTSERERLQLAVDRAKLEIEQAQEELMTAARAVAVHENANRQAQVLLMRRKLASPVEGMVVEVAKRAGAWVKPGDAVVRVLRLDRLRVEAILPPEMLLKPLKGSRVEVLVNLPDRGPGKYMGRIVFVRPELNPLNRQIRVWAEIDNREMLLRPGLSGSMVIHLADKPASKTQDARQATDLAPADSNLPCQATTRVLSRTTPSAVDGSHP